MTDSLHGKVVAMPVWRVRKWLLAHGFKPSATSPQVVYLGGETGKGTWIHASVMWGTITMAAGCLGVSVQELYDEIMKDGDDVR